MAKDGWERTDWFVRRKCLDKIEIEAEGQVAGEEQIENIGKDSWL